MKIEKTSNTFCTHIANVKTGDTFLYNEQLHIKIDAGSVQINKDRFDILILNLETNRLNSIDSNCKVFVTIVNAKIVI